MKSEDVTALLPVEHSGDDARSQSGDAEATHVVGTHHQRHPAGSHHERRQADKARSRSRIQTVAGLPVPRDGTALEQAKLDAYVAGEMLRTVAARLKDGHLAAPSNAPSNPDLRRKIEAAIAAAGAPPRPTLPRYRPAGA